VLVILQQFIAKDKYTQNHSYRVSLYEATHHRCEIGLNSGTDRGRVRRASCDSDRGPGHFRFVDKSLCARAALVVHAADRLRKGRPGFCFRGDNREACVLLAVCEAAAHCVDPLVLAA
jgi:hypothetical protein